MKSIDSLASLAAKLRTLAAILILLLEHLLMHFTWRRCPRNCRVPLLSRE